ncbi:MAG TPA: hypothetical protein VJT83_07645 [Chitinophagaceae bacterium]|nr:hypothetical protein [Chitinophagaceae bacterium]
MKELNPANWIYWFGLITVACMLLPIVAVLIRQQFNISFVALLVYFSITFLYNLLFIAFPDFPRDARRVIGIANNFLDVPLILLFLRHFCTSERVKKMLNISLMCFMIFELIIVAIHGFTVTAISIFEGPGIILILAFSFHFFTRYVKRAFSHKSEIAKTLMASGILFAYSVYFLVFLFYYVLKTPHKIDALIVYFFASLVASVLIAIGLLTFNVKPADGRRQTAAVRWQA